MAIAVMEDWEFNTVDVDSAFRQSIMPEDEPAYCEQPPGYAVKGKEHMVWFLRKALYGLKQSAHLWYQKLKEIMLSIGFLVCQSDPCIFICSTPQATSIVSSHFDSLGLFCSLRKESNLLKSQIRSHVPIKDAGPAQFILGIEIIRDQEKRTISLSHRHYIDTIVARFRQEDAKPVHTPMVQSPRLSKKDSPKKPKELEYMCHVPYQAAVGALMHGAVMT
jgi:hypothetical protein